MSDEAHDATTTHEVPADQHQPAPQLRRVLFGGVHREDAAALQDAHAATQDELRLARAALEETAGWAHRLPLALLELARLAAGESEGDDPFERLAAAVHEVAGAHLLSSVEFLHVYSPTPEELEQHTDWHGPGRPLTTEVRVGPHALRCAWEPTVLAGEDTVATVTGLCRAALFSLLGLAAASGREQRGIVTQLGDGHALARHAALRERLGQPTSELDVQVDAKQADGHRSLYGALSWEAVFADAGARLEEIAHRCGGQAYQLGPLSFRVLLDAEHGQGARAELEEGLNGGELEFHVRLLG